MRKLNNYAAAFNAYALAALVWILAFLFSIIFIGSYFNLCWLSLIFGVNLPSSVASNFVFRTLKKRFLRSYEGEDNDLPKSFRPPPDELRAKARELEVEGLYFYIEKHLTSLTRNLERAMRTDEYGGLVRDDRIKEIDRFLKSVNFEPRNLRQSGELYDLFVQIVALCIGTTASTGFDPNSYPEDGLQFEFWVAESLRHFGWDASPTIGSGDQGVDVTAQKEGVTLAIQCKRFAGSVGNKAVQEIVAGRAYYGLAHGVVISTGSYTKSAHELAQSCGIALLTPHDIPNIEQILKS